MGLSKLRENGEGRAGENTLLRSFSWGFSSSEKLSVLLCATGLKITGFAELSCLERSGVGASPVSCEVGESAEEGRSNEEEGGS